MCAFTTDFDRASAGYSPDSVDALVWALTDLLVESMKNHAFYEVTRQRIEEMRQQNEVFWSDQAEFILVSNATHPADSCTRSRPRRGGPTCCHICGSGTPVRSSERGSCSNSNALTESSDFHLRISPNRIQQ